MLKHKLKIIAVVGPTASGKSALGVYLAKKLGGEVVSADSRQVYRGMSVISRAEPGHMVGVADPRRQYSAGEYAIKAARACSLIRANKRIPIVVGGTGFYADALLHTPLPPVAPNKKLRLELSTKTLPKLHATLKRLDPKSAARVDPRNRVRLVRAIEIAKTIGKVPAQTARSCYEVLWLGLPIPKNYERVLRRGIEQRLRRGMLAEVKKLRKTLSKKRFAELGFEFRLLADYADKKISKEKLINAVMRGELRYARRQMRWFHRNPDIHWISEKGEALRLAKNFLSR